jgi:hypothetical protein
MEDLVRVRLHLTAPQAHKLHSGLPTTFKHHQLDEEGSHHLMLHKHKAKKVHHARKNKKGCRIQMSPYELEQTMHGEGFGDFLNKLKNIGSFIKNKIIDSDAYQSIAKPIVRQAVNAGVQALAPRLGAAAPLFQQGVDAIGSRTGAYGIHGGGHGTEKFVMESMVAPRPGGPAGFTAMPQAITGDGYSSIHLRHKSHYYPHRHRRGRRQMRSKSDEIVGSSFLLA